MTSVGKTLEAGVASAPLAATKISHLNGSFPKID
jgi:hypothetical protein